MVLPAATQQQVAQQPQADTTTAPSPPRLQPRALQLQQEPRRATGSPEGKPEAKRANARAESDMHICMGMSEQAQRHYAEQQAYQDDQSRRCKEALKRLGGPG